MHKTPTPKQLPALKSLKFGHNFVRSLIWVLLHWQF
jgi:hypothetical protein